MDNYNRGQIELYNSYIEKVFDVSHSAYIPEVSVIVVCYQEHELLEKCIEALSTQEGVNYEVILVNNGVGEGTTVDLSEYKIDKYIILSENLGAYMSRNIAARFANGRILVFIDDDGIASSNNFLKEFRDCFDKYRVVAVRGTCQAPEGIQPAFYHCGDKPYPAFPTLEGNCAFLRADFMKVGGWNDDIKFGGGGFEIGCRFVKAGYDYNRLMYSPFPVLIHKYSDDEYTVSEKQKRQDQGRALLRSVHPDWKDIWGKWAKMVGREDLLMKHGQEDKPLNIIEKIMKKKKKIKRLNFKEALNNHVMRFNGTYYTCYISEKEILDKLGKEKYIPYYRQTVSPKIIEFRRSGEKVVIKVVPRR